MTNEEKMKLTKLRKAGAGYKKIAQELNLSESTVKSFCLRNGLTRKPVLPAEIEEKAEKMPCLCCGKPVLQTSGRKRKKFCNKECRNRYWNAHIGDEKRSAMDEFTCPNCGKSFYAYGRKGRKYCCHGCYIEARFGGVVCE